MPPLTSDDAFALSKSFRDLSVALGDFRFAHWNTLEDEEWSLLNSASDMITKAVGLTLDESQAGAARLKSATASAQKAVKTLNDVRKIITVATASVGLAAAIVSKDPGAIAKNAKAVVDAATANA